MNNQNYFALFDIPQSVFIDTKILDKNYIALQKKYHPNRHSQSQLAQAQAITQSSIINDAYQILLNPARRAQHLLSVLAGEDLPKANPCGADFLTTMIELRKNLSADTTKKIDIYIMVLLKQVNNKIKEAQETNNWQDIIDINEKIVFLVNMKKQIA